MTKMTKNGVSTTAALGQEQFENFTRKVGRQDYRHTDGELFSCVRPTLDACRAARDAWLGTKAGAMA